MLFISCITLKEPEVTLQFIAANTKTILCVSTAESIGDTETDDIKKAITRALDAIFQ